MVLISDVRVPVMVVKSATLIFNAVIIAADDEAPDTADASDDKLPDNADTESSSVVTLFDKLSTWD